MFSGGYGPVPGYGGHAGDAFGGPNMGGPGQQYRGMNYPAGYPSSSGNMEPHQAGHFAGMGTSGPAPGSSVTDDMGGMQSPNVGRTGSTTSEDQVLSARAADGSTMSTQQTSSSDGSKDSGTAASIEGNRVRSAGPPSVEDSLGRQQAGMDSRPGGYPAGTDGMGSRYGQPGMDVRGGMQKQMFGQMPPRSTPFMNMNGVAIRPGQLPFGQDGAQGRGMEGMGSGPAQPNDMDSMPSRLDQPLVGQDGSQRRPGQPLQPDGMFGRQGPPPFGMDGRLGPPSGMDPMMRRTGHPLPDDGTMNRLGQNTGNVDARSSMHGMQLRGDESTDDSFRHGPQVAPGNMPIRPGMESMQGRPMPQMGAMPDGMSIRAMQPQHPGMDMMPGRPGQLRMDAMERRGGMPEGIGPQSQHPSYGHQYPPGYGAHPASGHPGHGLPQSGGFPAPDANAAGDQMFRNHMPPHGVHGDGRGPAAPSSGSENYRPGSEFGGGDQRHFMSNGDVDMMRRSGDPSFAPKSFESGECDSSNF